VSSPALRGLRPRSYGETPVNVEEITVDMVRLDDVLPPGYDLRLIKIDVEGAELEVLRGAIGIVERCRPYIIFEHGNGWR
jgi:FkbM family methyltransferase